MSNQKNTTKEKKTVKCFKCGSELQEGARFCSFCGANLMQTEAADSDVSAVEPEMSVVEASVVEEYEAQSNEEVINLKLSLWDKIKAKIRNTWEQLAMFYKVSLISLLGIIILFLVAYFTSKTFAIVCAVLQFSGVVVAMLLRKGIIKTNKKWLAYLVLIVAILLSVLNIYSYFWNQAPADSNNDYHPVVTTPGDNNSTDDTQVTETTAPVSKTALLPFDESECVGQNQEDIVKQLKQGGFSNISIESLAELGAEELGRKGEICTITIDGNDTFTKGAELDKTVAIKITYYEVKNVAAPIAAKDGEKKDTEELVNLFKEAGFVNVSAEIENDIDPEYSEETLRNEISIAYDGSFDTTDSFPIDAEVKITSHRPMEKYKVKINIDFIPNLFFNKYGVDVEIGYKELGTLSHGEDDSYEVWREPGKHTITFTKTGWLAPEKKVDITIKGETEVTYQIICYEDSIHVEQTEFVDMGAVGEGEAMIPASARDFKYDNYKDVENALKEAGFTNITTAILYDIVWGWTSEGEVDSVSVNGNKEFVKGNVFKTDAEIVITYHMWEEDDPNRQVEIEATLSPIETTPSPTEPPTTPPAETETSNVVLPKEGSKLAKDFDSKGTSTVYYINVDGQKNKPTITKWRAATVTDGVAEYLDYLENLGFAVAIESSSHREPYAGFNLYETDFKVTKGDVSWTMYLCIQDEDFVEYELDIHLD